MKSFAGPSRNSVSGKRAHMRKRFRLGLSQRYPDDHEMLTHGMVMYEALYAWCRSCQAETHNWPPIMA